MESRLSLMTSTPCDNHPLPHALFPCYLTTSPGISLLPSPELQPYHTISAPNPAGSLKPPYLASSAAGSGPLYVNVFAPTILRSFEQFFAKGRKKLSYDSSCHTNFIMWSAHWQSSYIPNLAGAFSTIRTITGSLLYQTFRTLCGIYATTVLNQGFRMNFAGLSHQILKIQLLFQTLHQCFL